MALKQVAERAGLSRVRLGRLEKGEVTVSLGVVLEMAMEAPWLTHRNPEKRRAAAEQVAKTHARFIARHGSDRALVAGKDVADVYAKAVVPSEGIDPQRVASGQLMARGAIEDSKLVGAGTRGRRLGAPAGEGAPTAAEARGRGDDAPDSLAWWNSCAVMFAASRIRQYSAKVGSILPTE